MTEYDEGAEVAGKYIVAFIQNMMDLSTVFGETTQEMFEDALGEEVDPEAWYKLGNVAQGYEMILKEVGPKTMKRGGKASAEALPFSDDMNLEEALDKLLEEHKKQYRNSDMGYPGGKYLYEPDGDKWRLGVSIAYSLPKPFVEGLYEGMVERFESPEGMIRFEETETKEDEKFVWAVSW